MQAWRTILVLLLVAVVAAAAWHWLAADPGYLQLRIRGTTIETSVVVALAMLVLAWLVVGIVWRLVRWPFRAWACRGSIPCCWPRPGWAWGLRCWP